MSWQKYALLLAVGCLPLLAIQPAQALGVGSAARLGIDQQSYLHQVRSRRDKIIEKLLADGFRNPQFQGRRLFGYVLHACRNGQLYRLSFDPLTVERRRVVIGDCGASLNPPSAGLELSEIRRLLRDEGYRGIRFTDRQLPRYGATACRQDTSYALIINRRGRVVSQSERGRCQQRQAARPTLRDLTVRLRRMGFYRVRAISRDLPPGRLEACKAGRLYQIRLSRSGNILSRTYKEPCRDGRSLSTADLRERLRARAYYRIQISAGRNRGMIAEACRLGRRFRLDVARSGRIVSRKSIGWCRLGRNAVPAVSQRILEHFPSGSRMSAEDCDDYLSAMLSRAKIRFETNSTEVSNRSARLLEEIGHVINQCPGTKIEVAGHTDSVGSTKTNNRLSRQRARSVVRHLVRREGVDRGRLTPTGYGESQPIARNDTDRGRARNRRIELVVLWSE